ncbi:MAG: hypothetical protein A3E07_00790 [Candidatus Wildermuthbacteria bacterium RIFCSPHIGHO2_12_FULL_45_9]|uniref:DDH domain-containing protein n=1 Tax=Candidatus Wildermuthbacteria bacterium RIFCSPHIGHO2_02_FULL_45_25 TaxID=1802450 RepID=A0A1G2R1K6_9BACT|nr:MAG: hypothetical protein A3C04_03555 [Candidatus Wildermuthbacteria bacterium RIFCSPHIGHO2_02_FULL_45_25]OHA71424.1 MAG: hypothetical protein A3E07_00790 [Candidatus Wildermuthbacteria bacterium RIFCSPHIGHO2_12_FULL_45_9]
MSIKNLQLAADRIKQAIAKKERIILYGDADLDGVSAIIILQEAIQNLGGMATAVYFPDREKEGYGITRKALARLNELSPALLVAADLGISNFEEIDLARQNGFEVIVIDHHKVLDRLPNANIIVDPKQPGDEYPFKEFAACGLAFRTAEALLGEKMSDSLRQNLVELAALGTIADMMAREQDNVQIIQEGLDALPYSWRPGIRAFLELPELNGTRTIEQKAQDMIGMLNVRDVKKGFPGAYRLLMCPSIKKAKSMMKVFAEKNKERRAKIEHLAEVVRMRIFHKKNSPLVFEGGEEFEYMLLGAVASIMSQETNKPAFIFKHTRKECLGSVRAPAGCDTVKAMQSCAHLFDTYGGHPQASGFRTTPERIDQVRDCLGAYFQENK